MLYKQSPLSYQQLHQAVEITASGLASLGLERYDRVAIFLPKTPENIISMLAASRAGGVFVPVNPVLKARQVQHILNDCQTRILITSSDRLKGLAEILPETGVTQVILTDKPLEGFDLLPQHLFAHLPMQTMPRSPGTDNDMAAILYTSGSTGLPKGVVLSHRNLVCGAHSVASYLKNHQQDVILALLPLSFDYGLSQVTTAFVVGASCVLLDYLLPNDVIKAVQHHQVTGLAAVPPLWQQLMALNWQDAGQSVRYFTNSGGAMPAPTLAKLRATFSNASPYLMYGLTEAFRSTFLPPEEVDKRPGSMGKAIPNAEILVVRKDGSECDPEEPGELVHRGPLVSLGYWNAPEKTAERFKPAPAKLTGLMLPELAVWSGDQVRKDADGYLYFVGRNDEMIKTSGYRVSPMEVEEACYEASTDIAEALACGVPDPMLGQAIAVRIVLKPGCEEDKDSILRLLKRQLPNFMHPKWLELVAELPRNPNGKVDRSAISKELKETYGNA
ncbi:acyl-CoA ligase (AMP-forming), exosortase A system-associated [Bowmanella dokdonensis]